MPRRHGRRKNQRSKNQSRNLARRDRMSISATMPMTTICLKRCRPNSGPPSRPRRIARRAAIRRRVAKKPVALRNLADQNRDVNQLHGRSHAERNQAAQNRVLSLAQSAEMNLALRHVLKPDQNLVPSVSRQPNVMSPHPARPVMPATIARATAAVRVRRAKIVLLDRNSPDPNNLEQSDRAQNSLVRNNRDQNNHAPSDQRGPSVPANVLPLPRVPSASISHRASVVPGPLPKSQSRKNPSLKGPSPKSPPLAHLRASRPANPRKNSPRRQPVPRNPRSPVWA